MIVSPARPGETPAWLALAGEGEGLFGPTVEDPGFRAALDDAIAAGTALSARRGSETIGGVVVDREGGRISRLVVAALDMIGRDRDARVQTFARGVPEANPARALHERFGFADERTAEPTPAGVPAVVTLRRPDQRAGTKGNPA